MAILQVARMGNPVLRKIAEPVSPGQLRTEEFQRFCDDLLESMYEQDGAGLAAPQVHESVRVVVFELDGDTGPIFLVNPVVTPVGTDTGLSYEGCLSVPEMRAQVRRFLHVHVLAQHRDGSPVEFEAHGYAARVVQHECDHLDGVLYVDRAEPGSLCFLKEFRRYGPPVPNPPRGDEEGDEEDDEEDDEE